MSRNKYTITPEYEKYRAWVERMPQEFQKTGTVICDTRNVIKLFTLADGKRFAVKRYRKPYIYQRFDYTFIRPSKTRRAYNYAQKMLGMSIDTPKPVAYIEQYSMGLFCYGYLITEYTTDNDCWILTEEPFPRLALSLAAFIADMHGKGVMHGDTNLSNFFYHADPAATYGYHISTIDINRTHFVASPTREQCLDNLVRMSHYQLAYESVIRMYALIRGWDATECLDYVRSGIALLERKEILKMKAFKK